MSSRKVSDKTSKKEERGSKSSPENSDRKERNQRNTEGKEKNRKESHKERLQTKEGENRDGGEEERSLDKDLLYPMRARKDNVLSNQRTSKGVESIQKNESNKVQSNPTKEAKSGQRKTDQLTPPMDRFIPPPDGFGNQLDSGDLMRESNERLISYIEKVKQIIDRRGNNALMNKNDVKDVDFNNQN